MAEPKLQGFPLNYTKACSSRRGKLTLFNTKSMRWPLFSVNYPAQISTWRVACEQANDWDRASTARLGQATKAEKKRVKDVERELARKDRALAETAALLVLRKKAAAIWGGDEDA